SILDLRKAWPSTAPIGVRHASEAVGRQMDRPNQRLVPRDREAIRHSGDEVADRAKRLDAAPSVLPRRRKQRRVVAIYRRQIGDYALGLGADQVQLRSAVQALVEKALQLPLLLRKRWRKSRELTTCSAYVVNCL